MNDMKEWMNNAEKKRFCTAAVMTCLCYLAVHGYRMFNGLFSGDALLMLHQNDYAWQISLGRFMQPLWLFIRGSLTAPFLISALAMVWLSLAVFLVTDLLEIRRPLYVFLTAAVMCCNLVITTVNASFLPWADLFPLAAFLSILSVWLTERSSRLLRCLGVAALVFSLGTYQAYVSVAIILVMILFLRVADRTEIPRFLLRYAVLFVAAGGIYYALWKLSQRVFDVWTSNGYNGLSTLGDYSGVSLIGLVGMAYRGVFSRFMNPTAVFVSLSFHKHSLDVVWVWALRLVHVLLAFLIVWLLIERERTLKTSMSHRVLTAVVVILFPLGMNVVCLISKGMVHDLMEYAFLFFYIFAFHLLEDKRSRDGDRVPQPAQWILLCILAVVLWTNAVFAAQVYLKRQLQEHAANALMTRIVTQLEEQPDYIPGETPIAFAGNFNNAPVIAVPEEFASLTPWGMNVTPMVYPGTEAAMLAYYLGAPANVVNVDAESDEVRSMPVYPADGSVKNIDGVLVVKISE